MSRPASPRLSLEHVCRRYGARQVVDDVSFSVDAGQVVCLLGPSGCGKSTTLKIIAGIERQDSGVVRIDARCVSDHRRHIPPEARQVGLMFQDFALFSHMSVAQNVGFGLTGRAVDRAGRVGALLEQFDLARLADKAPHMLSGGEQQRVALARVLAPRPRVMLMDEPFSSLDARLRDEVRDVTLASLKNEGTAVVLVTHDPDESMRMADKIALMRAGRIVQTAPPYALYSHPADRQAAAFFSDLNVVRARVSGGLCDTPFGRFLTPCHGEGDIVEIVFRPQHVRIDFDRNGRGPNPTETEGQPARARVSRARFMGKDSLIEFQTDHGTCVTATVPHVFLPPPGTRFWLSIRRDRCFVFKASGQGAADLADLTEGQEGAT